MSRPEITAIALLAVIGSGCFEQVDRQWFSQMKEQPAIQALEPRSPALEEGLWTPTSELGDGPLVGPWVPPENTVPAGGITPRIRPDNPMAANPMHSPEARALRNPIAPTPASLARGEKLYGVHCAVCHASDGMASPVEAPVAGRLAAAGAPPFPLASVPAYEDGMLYTKIRYGKPMMPAYPQISSDDRWHIVNYLRVLFPRS